MSGDKTEPGLGLGGERTQAAPGKAEVGHAATLQGVGHAATLAGVGSTVSDTAAAMDETAAPTPGDRVRTAKIRPSSKPAIEPLPEVPGYKMLGRLGEGGMGTVYIAEQQNPRRKVAIKMLSGRSPGALARFQNEAEVMGRLDHPGLARVLEAGESDGAPYLAMEFIDGTTLEVYAKEAALQQKLELFAGICDAVHHAHVHGVIHRDLKPSNVMVREGTRPVVLDFGVARLAHDITPGPTRAGELIGTPLYMSPEQAKLRPDEVDARTDVYTLGVILYELAANALPYNAERGMTLNVLTRLICDEPPVPLSKRAPELRGDLEAICAKALAKEPGDRYQSVAALGDDVRRFLDHRQVSVRMPNPAERLRRFIKRRPFLAATIGGSALALATFAVVITMLWLDARGARLTANRERDAARAAELRSEQDNHTLQKQKAELVLKQARAALTTDPTEAVAWVATLPDNVGVDPQTAWSIIEEARARGIAHDVLKGHVDEVHWVEAAGKDFISSSYDGRVILWEGVTPHTLFTSRAGRVHTAKASPDGMWVLIGGDHGLFHVVSRDGRIDEELKGPIGDVERVAWSPDGEWRAAGDDVGNVWIFAKGSKEGRQLKPKLAQPLAPAQPSKIEGMMFGSGDLLVAGNDAGLLTAWSIATGEARTVNVGPEITEVWASATRVAAADADGRVHVFSIGAHQLDRLKLADVGQKCKRAAFASDGSWAVLGSVAGEVFRVALVDTATSAPGVVKMLARHGSTVRSIAVSEDGRLIASGGDDGTLFVHDLAREHELALRGHSGRIRHVSFAGNTLYSSDSDGVVRRWQLDDIAGTVLASAGPPLLQLAVTSTGLIAGPGDRIVGVDAKGDVASWTIADGIRHEIGHVDGHVADLVMQPDGTTVITGTVDGDLAWWPLPPVPGAAAPPLAQPVHRKRPDVGILKQIAVSSDRIAIATSAGPIALESTKGSLGLLPGHNGGGDVVAFTGDGMLLASAGQDRVIRVWHREGDKLVAAGELDGPRGDTHFITFTPKGDRLISTGNDGAVLQWNVRDGAVDATSRKVLAQHTGAVTALAVSDSFVVSAGRDTQVIRIATAGATTKTTLPTAATQLVIEDDGTVDAVTRTGAAVRWPMTRDPVVEIDHGVVTAARLPGKPQWVLAFDDGALLIASLRDAPLADLRAEITKLTTFKLP